MIGKIFCLPNVEYTLSLSIVMNVPMITKTQKYSLSFLTHLLFNWIECQSLFDYTIAMKLQAGQGCRRGRVGIVEADYPQTQFHSSRAPEDSGWSTSYMQDRTFWGKMEVLSTG